MMPSYRRDDTWHFSDLFRTSVVAPAASIRPARHASGTVAILKEAVGPAEATRAVAVSTESTERAK